MTAQLKFVPLPKGINLVMGDRLSVPGGDALPSEVHARVKSVQKLDTSVPADFKGYRPQ